MDNNPIIVQRLMALGTAIHFESAFARGLAVALRGKLAGRVLEVIGNQVRVTGVPLQIGQICALTSPNHEPYKHHETANKLLGEVVGINADSAVLMLLGDVTGLSRATKVYPLELMHSVQVGTELLGRVLDGLGQPIDGGLSLGDLARRPSIAPPPAALSRPLIREVMITGVRTIDGLLTVGKGQRIGIFAPAGVGKSMLLSMIAQGIPDCICVVALIGERGREVREFLDITLTPEQLRHTVVVVATSDRPSMERIKAAYTATAIAEYFRDLGHDVLLLCDSVTRFARALRETGLAAGEQPVRRGYPPSVFTALPKLMERAGPSERGSITAFYTVLLDDGETADPIGEEVRSLLDGHISLSQKLAGAGHFPAIDVRQSVSRLMPHLVSPSAMQNANRCRDWLSTYADAEMLLQIGEYKAGNDAHLDAAIAAHPALQAFLRQTADAPLAHNDVHLQLQNIVETHSNADQQP